MVDGNALRVALVTLGGACAVSGGVVLLLPRIAIPEDVAAAPPAVDAAAVTAPPATEETLADRGPSFDTVRVTPDGSGLVAGQAEPGATIDVIAGEDVAAQAVADADGRFVAFLDLPASDTPMALSLRDGAGSLSEETVIVAPRAQALAARANAPQAQPPSARPGAGPEAEPSPAAQGPADASGAGFQAPGQGSSLSPDAPPAPSDGLAAEAAPQEPGLTAVVDPTGPAPPATTESAGQAPVLVSDAEGVRVLQPALPPGAEAEVLDSVALDAIAYGGSGEVMISGRGAGSGAVRLYLDNEPVAESAIGPDGHWSVDLGDAAPGVYTLRVDQIDASGQVVSRIETPFQREGRDEIAAALAGTDGAGGTIAMRTVQPGNTLWAIARERYGEPLMYVSVFEANRDRIRNPDLIYPGQVFVLPATKAP